jgi:hypothetical protein
MKFIRKKNTARGWIKINWLRTGSSDRTGTRQ